MNDRKPERRGLGRGLSALMADIRVDAADNSTSAERRSGTNVAIDRLLPNPQQPRRDFVASELEALTDSIRQKGILQPLIVRPAQAEGMYEIVAGERRWRAAQTAQLHEVPVLIRDFDDTEVLEVAIIENIQRSDLNAIEEAAAYRQLMDRFGHTQEKMAEALSKSRSHIANQLRLLSLPEEVQRNLREGRLTAGHARALITSSDPAALARQVIVKGLSVRETERLARTIAGGKVRGGRAGPPQKDADTLAIERDLAAALELGVSIWHESGSNRGKLTVVYNSLDDLDFLCRALSVARRDGV
jgi:ParB family transcriptional regulator, chromosome partitioning protein